MENDQRIEHMRRTRFIKPVEPCNFTVAEMISGLFASLSPALIASVNQLHGERKGVVRVTCKTLDAVNDLDTKIAARKVLINGIRLAPVTESGFFVRVTLTDMPEYISNQDLEREMSEYGAVVHSKREFVDYHGYRVENETRHILLSYLTKEIPPTIRIDGQEVFVTYHRNALKVRPPLTIDEVISHPDNIPRHVINNMREHPADGLLARPRSSTPKPGNPLTEMEIPTDQVTTAQSVPNTPKSNKRLPLTNSPYPARRKAPASSVPNLVEAAQAQQDTRAHGTSYYTESTAGIGHHQQQHPQQPQLQQQHRSSSTEQYHVDPRSHQEHRSSNSSTIRLASDESNTGASHEQQHHHHHQQQQQQQQLQQHAVCSSNTRLADDREMESHL